MSSSLSSPILSHSICHGIIRLILWVVAIRDLASKENITSQAKLFNSQGTLLNLDYKIKYKFDHDMKSNEQFTSPHNLLQLPSSMFRCHYCPGIWNNYCSDRLAKALSRLSTHGVTHGHLIRHWADKNFFPHNWMLDVHCTCVMAASILTSASALSGQHMAGVNWGHRGISWCGSQLLLGPAEGALLPAGPSQGASDSGELWGPLGSLVSVVSSTSYKGCHPE